MKLCDIIINKEYIVCDIDLEDEMKRRFRDLGLVSGSKITCVGRSPMGDPRAYLIKGAVIAIRKEESGKIMVKEAEKFE